MEMNHMTRLGKKAFNSFEDETALGILRCPLDGKTSFNSFEDETILTPSELMLDLEGLAFNSFEDETIWEGHTLLLR